VSEELKPCAICGSECRIEVFTGSHIQGEMRLWICSNDPAFGGDCPHRIAYLSAEWWNMRPEQDTIPIIEL